MINSKDIPDKIDQLGLGDKNTECKSSWMPESFEWLRPARGKVLEVGKKISITKNTIKITAFVVEEAGFTTNDKLAFGYNKAYVAFRKDEKGFPLKASQSKKNPSLLIQSKTLIELLVSIGFEIGTSHDVTWDLKSKMLVVKIPKAEHKSSVAQPNKNKKEV